MAARTPRADMLDAAGSALTHALASLGLSSAFTSGTNTVTTTLPSGTVVFLNIDAASVVTEDRVHLHSEPDTVLVADAITEDARALLTEAGTSWFDRRGHLRLIKDDVFVDADVTPASRRPESTTDNKPIRGAAAIGSAAAALLGNDDFSGNNELARILNLSPSSISRARAALRDNGLLGSDPDSLAALFHELAEAWQPAWTDLATTPDPDDHLVAAGTRAAAALGAPIIANEQYPLELYCTNHSILERLRLRNRPESGASNVVTRLAAAPTILIEETATIDRIDGHRIAHPLFLALDLAQDVSRGAEALAEWDPPGRWRRVW